MILMLARHKVEDSLRFKEGYYSEDVITIRHRFDVSNDALYTTTENPNDVLVIHYFNDVETAHAFLNSEKLKVSMMQLGVIEEP